MWHKKLIALGALLVLVLLLSGCAPAPDAQEVDGGEPVEQERATQAPQVATPQRQATPKPAQEVETESEEEAVPVVDVESLDSYRQLVAWTTTEGDETGEWAATTEFVRDPPAKRTHWVGTDGSGQETDWEVIEIGTTVYMRISGQGKEAQWMTIASEDSQPPQDELGFYQLRGSDYMDSEHCERRGRDDIEGHRAVHYVCGKGVFGPDELGPLAGGQLTDGGYEFWISEEFNVQVQAITWWEGEDRAGVFQAVRMEQKVWDINVPFTIEVPEGADASNLPDDVPLPPDATIISSMAGMVNFEVVAEIEQVTAFYVEEMEANGWALESELMGMLNFVKDGRTVSVMLAEEGGTVTGTIITSE